MADALKDFLSKTEGKYFYVCDTETTGIHLRSSDVIEVSAIKVYNNDGRFEIVDTFDSFINPQYMLPRETLEFNIMNNTGIDDNLLSRAPLACEVAPRFKAFLEGEPIFMVGHNIDGFDVPFIKKLMENNGLTLGDVQTFDTLTYSKPKISGKHTLGCLFEKTDKYHSKGNPQAHLSIGDCYMTLDVLEYLKNEFGQPSLFDFM
ncbi:MAG: 3'-5' exonuclease [Lachnospiraceae bacterium]|nr:3'-5' exonuclease [Lachnospiraceae bacterium]